MMQGKTSILQFAIQACEISYILGHPDGACSVHLKNGTVIAAQESFETVTEAYEKIVKPFTPLNLEVLEHGSHSTVKEGIGHGRLDD